MKRYKISVITRDGMFCFYMPEWYCKPTILESVCFYLHKSYEDGFIKYVKCQRYPSKVILSKNHPEYVVYAMQNIDLPNGVSFSIPVFI